MDNILFAPEFIGGEWGDYAQNKGLNMNKIEVIEELKRRLQVKIALLNEHVAGDFFWVGDDNLEEIKFFIKILKLLGEGNE